MGAFLATIAAAAGGAAAVYFYHVRKSKELGVKPVNIGDALKAAVNTLKDIKSINELSYDFIMKSVTDNRPDDIRVVKVALLREKLENEKTKISVVYMDTNNKPIFGDGAGKEYGFAYTSTKIAQDLLDIFDKDDLVVLE